MAIVPPKTLTNDPICPTCWRDLSDKAPPNYCEQHSWANRKWWEGMKRGFYDHPLPTRSASKQPPSRVTDDMTCPVCQQVGTVTRYYCASHAWAYRKWYEGMRGRYPR